MVCAWPVPIARAAASSTTCRARTTSPRRPKYLREISFRRRSRVLPEAEGEIAVARGIVDGNRGFEMLARAGEIAGEPAGQPGRAVRDAEFSRVGAPGGFAQKGLRDFQHRRELAAHVIAGEEAVIRGASFARIGQSRRQFARPRKRGRRFRRLKAPRRDQRIAEADLKVNAPPAHRGRVLHRIAFSEHGDKGLRFCEFGELSRRR
jgi:hypothetical protein